MALFKLLSDEVSVVVRSIREHARTADCDDEGRLLNTGGDGVLCSAVDQRGGLVVYAETNGDSVLLSRHNAAEFAALIGDNEDATQGLERLRALADELRYEDDDAFEDISECISAAETELGADVFRTPSRS